MGVFAKTLQRLAATLGLICALLLVANALFIVRWGFELKGPSGDVLLAALLVTGWASTQVLVSIRTFRLRSGLGASLLAIGVSALLLGVSLPNLRRAREVVWRQRATNGLTRLARALRDHRSQHGSYPASLRDGLGPSVSEDPPLRDPWGRPYV
jgi:hypothetical protein